MKRRFKKFNDPRLRKFVKKIGPLLSTIESEHWGPHNLAVACASFLVALALGRPLPECDRIGFAAYLHDYGKQMPWLKPLFAPNKGKHTPEESELKKQHSHAGVELFAIFLQGLEEEGMERVKARVHQHIDELTIQAIYDCQINHDVPYSEGGGKRIPLVGRICRLVDAYDTMTTVHKTGREYRGEPKPELEARRELLNCAGSDFDPDLVMIFLRKVVVALPGFRPGSLTPRKRKGAAKSQPFPQTKTTQLASHLSQ